MMYLPIYMISPFLGGMFAGFFHKYIVQTAYNRAEKAADDEPKE